MMDNPCVWAWMDKWWSELLETRGTIPSTAEVREYYQKWGHVLFGAGGSPTLEATISHYEDMATAINNDVSKSLRAREERAPLPQAGRIPAASAAGSNPDEAKRQRRSASPAASIGTPAGRAGHHHHHHHYPSSGEEACAGAGDWAAGYPSMAVHEQLGLDCHVAGGGAAAGMPLQQRCSSQAAARQHKKRPAASASPTSAARTPPSPSLTPARPRPTHQPTAMPAADRSVMAPRPAPAASGVHATAAAAGAAGVRRPGAGGAVDEVDKLLFAMLEAGDPLLLSMLEDFEADMRALPLGPAPQGPEGPDPAAHVRPHEAWPLQPQPPPQQHQHLPQEAWQPPQQQQQSSVPRPTHLHAQEARRARQVQPQPPQPPQQMQLQMQHEAWDAQQPSQAQASEQQQDQQQQYGAAAAAHELGVQPPAPGWLAPAGLVTTSLRAGRRPPAHHLPYHYPPMYHAAATYPDYCFGDAQGGYGHGLPVVVAGSARAPYDQPYECYSSSCVPYGYAGWEPSWAAPAPAPGRAGPPGGGMPMSMPMPPYGAAGAPRTCQPEHAGMQQAQPRRQRAAASDVSTQGV